MYILATIFYAVYNRPFEFPVDTRSLQTCVSRVFENIFLSLRATKRKIYKYIRVRELKTLKKKKKEEETIDEKSSRDLSPFQIDQFD